MFKIPKLTVEERKRTERELGKIICAVVMSVLTFINSMVVIAESKVTTAVDDDIHDDDDFTF